VSAARESEESSRRSSYSWLLLGLVVTLVFAVRATPAAWHRLLYNVVFSATFLCAALSLNRNRNAMVAAASVAIAGAWLAFVLDLPIVLTLSRLAAWLYFVLVVIRLISQIARTRIVTVRVILESINGYLLLGIVFAVTMLIVEAVDPGAFSIGAAGAAEGVDFSVDDAFYFAFVTYTTLGYGDILPTSALGRAVAMATSVCGQIYLTVIIAMLVGKFLGRSRQEG
jgi:hypothetical protein